MICHVAEHEPYQNCAVQFPLDSRGGWGRKLENETSDLNVNLG